MTGLLLAAAGLPAFARMKVVMVVVPAVSLRDMASADLPNFGFLLDSGCVGLMNTRTAGRITTGNEDFTDGKYAPEAGYLTIGAGARTTAGCDAARAYNADEPANGAPARLLYQRMTLIDPGKAEVVHPGIARLTRDNSTFSYDVRIGAIGSALHRAGLKTAVIGNSDDGQPHREAVTIAMDEDGLVDYGNVGPEMVTRDPTAPSGYRTNEKKLLSEYAQCVKQADFIVVELGDTARLDRARQDMTEDAYARQRARALKRMDAILGKLIPNGPCSAGRRVIVVSPYPSSRELTKYGNSLCPISVYDQRSFHRSGACALLTSGSTRTDGIVADTDVAPSIIEWLKPAAERGLVGRPIEPGFELGDQYPALDRIIIRTVRQSAAAPVLRQAMAVAMALAGVAALLWLWMPKGSPVRRKLITAIALIPPALAPAMLLLALRPNGSQFVTWVQLAAVTAGIVGVAALIGRKAMGALMLISMATAGLLLADTALGNRLCRSSIMGYSVAEGARYYGIGNEFMGSLIGASLVGLGLCMGSLRARVWEIRAALVAGLVVVTAAVGAPILGANMGGAISAVVGFGCALMATSKKAFDIRKALGIAVGVALFIGAFAYLDSLRGPEHASHLGRALQGIRTGGAGEAGMIIKRKLAMNWMLIRYAIWSRVLGALVGAWLVTLVGRRTPSPPMPMHMRVAIMGAVGGTLAALVFNDSGVVAAATAFVYPWSLLMLTALEPTSGSGSGAS